MLENSHNISIIGPKERKHLVKGLLSPSSQLSSGEDEKLFHFAKVVENVTSMLMIVALDSDIDMCVESILV